MRMTRYIHSLNKSLNNMFENHDNIILLGEDILDPYGGAFKVALGLSTKFPERVYSTPISEAAITGIGTGLALKGMRPIVEIMFGDFITLCADQIINGISKYGWMYGSDVSIPLVIRTPMGGYRGYGPTHSQSLESFFMSVPDLTIISPSIYHSPGRLLESSVIEDDGPILFIENKTDYPKKLIDKANINKYLKIREIHKTNIMYPTISIENADSECPDVTLITYGGMAEIAVEALKNVFMEEEINVEVLVTSLVKPYPFNDIFESIEKSKHLVILEEGNRFSGWGAELTSTIYEAYFEKLCKPIVRIGSENHPIPSSILLEKKCLPQLNEIEKALVTILN
jgi:pyruvate/2-oxoglutarate/acetoin dehydrogenase E1 component